MPQNWLDLKKAIFSKLRGKKNPRTGKPYKEEDLYAIAVAAYKKKYGHAPARESFDYSVRFNAPIGIVESVEEKDFKGAIVGGVAIEPTTSKNKILYTQEDLEPAVGGLIGKKILKDHERTVASTVGKVTHAWYENGVKYKGEIPEIDSNKDIIDKIKAKIIDQVSIGASVRELIEKEVVEADGKKTTVFKPVGLEFEELSLTPTPGIENASISLVHALTEAVQSREKALGEDWSEEVDDIQKNVIVKGDTMNDEEKLELEKLRAFKSEIESKAAKEAFKKEVLADLKKELIEDDEDADVDEHKDPPKPDEAKLKGEVSEKVDKKFNHFEGKYLGSVPVEAKTGDYVVESQGHGKVAFYKL